MQTAAQSAITASSLKFRADGTDYVAGDEREYRVIRRGVCIGTVSPDWQPSAREGGEPVAAWCFRADTGECGFGRTRAAAVLNAYPLPAV
jgi:hypothetical protein